MAEWYLKFGVTGVQEFISHARATSDLAAGSRIVSRLTKAAWEACESDRIKVEWGVQVERILPAPLDQIETDWPHQLIVRLTADAKGPVENVGDWIADQALESWSSVARKALDELPADVSRWLVDEAKARSTQIENAFDFLWVAIPASLDSVNPLQELLRVYDDRKQTRTFSQLEPFEKRSPIACSLCGVRAAIVQPPPNYESDSHFLRKRERLCAVCAAKRWHSRPHIPSTHRIARAPFWTHSDFNDVRRDLGEEGLKDQEINRLLDVLDEIEDEPVRSDPYYRKAVTAYERLKQPHRDTWERICRLAYYAIIVFDGDKMGRWLSGERFAETYRSGEEFKRGLQTLSEALLRFADQVRQLCEGLAGRPPNNPVTRVYLGGDEGLILCPLPSLMDFLAGLDKAWREAIGPMDSYRRKDEGVVIQLPTLSAHVSIVHAKAPLQAAVKDVHGKITLAKEATGGDVLSIEAHPHSGPATWARFHWSELDSLAKALELFQDNVLESAEDAGGSDATADRLGLTLLRSLLESIEPFVSRAGFHDGRRTLVLDDIMERDWERILKQSGKEADPARYQWLTEWLIGRTRRRWPEAPAVRDDAETIASALALIGFLARQVAVEYAP